MNKAFYRFVAKAFLLYVTWSLLYHGWIGPHTRVEETLTVGTTTLSAYLLRAFGYRTEIANAYEQGTFVHSEVYVDGVPGILVGNPCNGLELFALFVGFMLAYPGRPKLKAGYIFFGLAVLFAANLVRIQILVMNYLYGRSSFDFNHKYTYTVAVYLIVFALWMRWVNKYSHSGRSLAENRKINETLPT